MLADVAHAAQALENLTARRACAPRWMISARGSATSVISSCCRCITSSSTAAMIDGIAGDPARSGRAARDSLPWPGRSIWKVIAEGVESEAQRVLAASEGCAFYQGFLRAQPMGAAEFLELASR
jgi:hypothetical protein